MVKSSAKAQATELVVGIVVLILGVYLLIPLGDATAIFGLSANLSAITFVGPIILLVAGFGLVINALTNMF